MKIRQNRSIWYLTFFVYLFFQVNITKGQNQVRPNSYGQWLMYFGDNKINKKIGIHSEAQLRNYLVKETLVQTMVRLGINYYVDPLVMVSAGYGYFDTRPSDENVIGFSVSENRIWEQLILRHKTKAVFMEHRYRLEQRFLFNHDTKATNYDNRVRYRFQSIFPFYSISPHLRHYFFSSYNEFFANLGTRTSGQIFDRNRFYVAFGYQVSPKLNFQLGYLNQMISVQGVDRPDVNHNLQIGINYNMDDLMQSFFQTK